MSGIQIPVKQIILNDAAQLRFLRNAAAAGTYVENPSTVAWLAVDGFTLETFLGEKLVSDLNVINASGQKRVLKDDAASTGVAELKSYVIAATTAPADSVFRLVYESLDLTPVEFQNQAQEKRYQIPVQTTAAGIATAIFKAINADKSSPVTATNGVAGTVILTAKAKGVKFGLYSTDIVLPAATTETKGALAMNTYDYLKNIEWAKNLDFDRNASWMPMKGASYAGYYFEVKSTSMVGAGGLDIASQLENQSVTGFKIWINTGLTALAASFLEFADDVNAL